MFFNLRCSLGFHYWEDYINDEFNEDFIFIKDTQMCEICWKVKII